MSNVECSICIESFNKKTRKKVDCPKCNSLVCSQCYVTHCKQNQVDPSCMYCDMKFSKTFISESFTKKFINNDLKEIKMNQILNTDLQEMHKYIQFAKYDKYLHETNIMLDKKLIIDDNYLTDAFGSKIILHKEEYLDDSLKVKKAISDWYKTYRLPTNKKEQVTDKKQFVKKCTKSGCNGFLSLRWKCELCDTKFCKNCLEECGENHECNSDNVASAEEIRKNSKNCPNPNCAVPIFKILGCSHMFCVQCHTCFDWNTMRIQASNTNPHLYEYLQNNDNLRRDVNDMPCGGFDIVNFYSIYRSLMKKMDSSSKNSFAYFNESFVSLIMQFYSHNIDHRVSRLGFLNQQIETYNDQNHKRFIKLKVEYLNSKISEDDYKRKMYTHTKRHDYLNDMYSIIETFNQSLMYHLQNFETDIITFIKEYKSSKKLTFDEKLNYPSIGHLLAMDDYFDTKFYEQYTGLVWKNDRKYGNINELIHQNIHEIASLMNYINKVLISESNYYNYGKPYQIKEEHVYGDNFRLTL